MRKVILLTVLALGLTGSAAAHTSSDIAFRDLDRGEVFNRNGRVYMRTSGPDEAVVLHGVARGWVNRFDPDAIVTPSL